MDLYHDGDVYVYTDYKSNFIVHPYYDAKTAKGKMKKVNYITATKVLDPNEFKLKNIEKYEFGQAIGFEPTPRAFAASVPTSWLYLPRFMSQR